MEETVVIDFESLIPYIAYIIAFVFVVIAVLWVVSINLIKKNKMSVKDWSKRALGLPQGSVRALLAFMILFLVFAAVIVGNEFPDIPEWLVGILGSVVGFYFGAASVKPQEQKPTGGEQTETSSEEEPKTPPADSGGKD